MKSTVTVISGSPKGRPAYSEGGVNPNVNFRAAETGRRGVARRVHWAAMNGPARIWNYLARESIWLPIIAVFVISMLLVSPRGEFPLNDDWIHARVVRDLVEHGHYEHHPYLTATFVAQAYWGALFTWLFGFSFTVLRLSTLVLAVVGGWAVARAAMALGLPRGLALLCGILCCANPLMMNLAYSFMTDVPFLAACSLAGCCFLIYLRDPR